MLDELILLVDTSGILEINSSPNSHSAQTSAKMLMFGSVCVQMERHPCKSWQHQRFMESTVPLSLEACGITVTRRAYESNDVRA